MKEATPPAAHSRRRSARARRGAAPATRPPSKPFQKVTQLPADTAEHRQVIDLSWLAIGRLLYETDSGCRPSTPTTTSIAARPSSATMLYELAWVYVRLGDVDRAQRALEVLAIADPNSPNIADGTLLRADSMLRAGQFDKALKALRGVRAHSTIRCARRSTRSSDSTNDPAVYYDKLSQEQLEAGSTATRALPPLAVQWAREAEDGPRRSRSSTTSNSAAS